MILEIPFRFSVRGMKEANALNSSSTRWDVARIDIPETTAEEAPIAVEWRDGNILERDVEPPTLSPSRIVQLKHTRFFEESHWLPFMGGKLLRAHADTPISAATFSRLIASGEGLPPLRVPPDARRPATADPYDGFTSVEFSSRESQLAEISNALSSLIVVDGIIYQKAAEPIITVNMETSYSTNRNGERVGGYGYHVRINADPDFELTTDMTVFPIDDFDAALTLGRRRNTASNRKSAYNEANEARRPSIAEFRTNDTPPSHVSMIRRYADAFVCAFERLPLREMDTESVRLYADIRDFRDTLPDNAAIEGLEDTAHAFLQKHQVHERLQGQTTACVTFLRKLTQTAESRPIDMPMSAHTGFSHEPR